MNFGRLPRQRPPRFPHLPRQRPPRAENSKAEAEAISDARSALLLARSTVGNVGRVAEHLELAIAATEDAQALVAERNK